MISNYILIYIEVNKVGIQVIVQQPTWYYFPQFLRALRFFPKFKSHNAQGSPQKPNTFLLSHHEILESSTFFLIYVYSQTTIFEYIYHSSHNYAYYHVINEKTQFILIHLYSQKRKTWIKTSKNMFTGQGYILHVLWSCVVFSTITE